ncbi:MAG: preprotein translocase subunit YajC [Chloroflexota bacterium]
MKRKILSVGLIVALLISMLALAGCVPATEGGEQGGFNPQLIIFLVLIVAVFYFLIIRPQRKRQKDQQQLMEGLRKGETVVTAGGIYGQIESVREDIIVLKVESGATIKVARSSIAGKVNK